MNIATLPTEIDNHNRWRAETPGHDGWARSPRPGAASKYTIISVDSHITPPPKLMSTRIENAYKDRLPRAEKRDDGMWMIVDGMKPFRVLKSELEGEDEYRARRGSSMTIRPLPWRPVSPTWIGTASTLKSHSPMARR